MRAANILILTALTMEARAVHRAGLSATVVGIGAKRLDRVAVPPGTFCVLMAGVCGAVDPALAVGDVVVDGAVHALPDGVRRGAVHTVDRVLATAGDKAAVCAATGAAVVDMEQAVVRAWADRHGLRVIGLRAVSDAAGDAVDPAVVRFVTDVGRPRPVAIAAALLRRPGLVRHLWRLNAHTRLALARLAAVLPDVVASIERDC